MIKLKRRIVLSRNRRLYFWTSDLKLFVRFYSWVSFYLATEKSEAGALSGKIIKI